jgi:MFS family permease
MTGNAILGTTAAIVGNTLAADKALSTLPVAIQMTGTMLATVPAALLMARIGRRGGFWAGTAIGVAGAAIATLAIFAESFPLFCTGTLLIGANTGFVQQYRFAASEAAADAFPPRRFRLFSPAASCPGCLGRRPRSGRATCSLRSCSRAATR